MMNALPLFPQSASPSVGSMTGSAPPSLSGEQGGAISFNALLNQSAQTSGDVASATASTPPADATRGSFEDLGVLLQLFRAASGGGTDPVADPASRPLDMLPAGARETAEAPFSDILGHLAAQTHEDAAAPAMILPPMMAMAGTDGPLSQSQIVAQALGQPADMAQPDKMTLPVLQDARISILPKDAGLAPSLPDTPLPSAAGAQAEDLTMKTQQPAAILQATAATIAPLILSTDTLPQAAQLVAAESLMADATRKTTAPASAHIVNTALQNGGDAPPRASAFARMAAAPNASPTLAPPALAQIAAPFSADSGAAMTVIFHQTPAANYAAPLDAATPAASVQEQILDLSSDDGWIDQLAKDIAAAKSGTGDISFRLMPRHLGRLDVAMTQNEQGISVHMEAQNEVTASIVAAGQTRLVEELRQQGVRVASADITHSPQDTGRQSQGRDGQGQQPAGQHFIETAPDRLPDPGRSDTGAGDPRGRFA